jgi:hypothetical protein
LGKATPVEISDRIFDRGDRTSAGLTIASRNARDDQGRKRRIQSVDRSSAVKDSINRSLRLNLEILSMSVDASE